MRVNEAIERKLKPGFSTTKDYASKLKRLTQLESAISVEFSDFKKLIAITEKLFEASVVQFIIDLANIQSIKTPIKSTHGGIIQNDLIDSVEKSFNIEKLISLIEKNKNIHPQIALHYYWLKIHKNPENTEYYFLLRDLFYNNLSEMDREEKSILFNFLINYCIQRFNIDFMRESFELYKKMIEYSAYSESENEYMQILMYRNLIQTCISLGETKWLRNFLSTYNEILSPNYQEDMKHLSYAYLYFTEKEFEKALVSISKINNEVFIFKADVRNLLLRVYYELEFFEQAYSLVDAFKHYLSKSKEISQVSRIVHNNYLNFYHRLLKIRTGNSKEHPEFVKSGLEVENKIINKKWLLEKLEKLTSFRKDKK